MSAKLMAHMYKPIGRFISASGSTSSCKPQYERLGMYLRQLRLVKGLPPFDIDSDENVLEKLETQILSGIHFMKISLVKSCKRKCLRCDEDFQQHIRDVVDSLRDDIGYLCLECVKSGDFELGPAPCVKHWTSRRT